MEQPKGNSIDKFKPPKDTEGIRQLYPDAKKNVPPILIQVDIVAVHGLGGDAFNTWTKGDTLWLRDLLPKLGPYTKARVLTFGYDARAFLHPFEHSLPTGRAFTFAESLISDLDDWRQEAVEKTRPLIFIGHSLGGLVIKQSLCHAHTHDERYGSILKATKAILFFGTPHQGGGVAGWATILGKLGRMLRFRDTQVTKDLQTWSHPLVELSDSFSNLPSRHDIRIYTYFEAMNTNGIKVVEEGSARMHIPQETCRSINTDHIQICKFGPDDDNWNLIVRMKFQAIAREIQLQDVLPSVLLNEPTGSQGSLEDTNDQDTADASLDLFKRFAKLKSP